MNAQDVMTSPVFTVAPDTPVRDISALLLARHISGVPVLDQGEVVGIVSKSDLLHRYEAEPGGAPPHPWWQRWVQRTAPPRDYVRAHALRAADLMTREPVSIAEDLSLARVAQLLTAYRIQRLPVVRGRRLVGIVTSGDLVKALLRQAEADTASADACDDAQILARLVAELERQTWWSRAWSHVSVDNGIVMYHGMVGNEAERDAARVAAEGIAGVRGVVDERLCTIEWQTMV